MHKASLDHQDFSTPSYCLDKVFIEFKTLEGAVTWKGAVITKWRFKPMTNQIVSIMSPAITI